jgi:type IV pilus assembly protein PilE
MDRQRSFDSEDPRALHSEVSRLRSRGRAGARSPGSPCRGFTVLEVLLVVATVSTVTAIAVPSYVHQLRKSARAEAESFLLSAAAKQQQHLLAQGRYAGNLGTLDAQPPAFLSGKYMFVVAATGGSTPAFTLNAIAAGEQAKDACPTLTIDSSGTKLPVACW